MTNSGALAEFDTLLEAIGDGVPNSRQYQRMSSLILDFPEARVLAAMDPFSAEYRAAAMALYLSVRGRAEQGYVAARDEAPSAALPNDLWRDLIPWSFRDAKVVSEHLHAWGHILHHLNLPERGSLLEYGPGSGQLLLMAARMGYRACGVDIDRVALAGIDAQATHLGLHVETERAEFGHGFGQQTFDTVLFYEAFHHAFDFDALLERLHARLNPGGRIVLCGEPVVGSMTKGIPFPWGPRLDALSVFCMRRFGWMELGFTHDFLMRVTRSKGWAASFHPFPDCGRAAVYVLKPDRQKREATAAPADPLVPASIESLQRALADLHASTSWRVTRPLRALRRLLDRA